MDSKTNTKSKNYYAQYQKDLRARWAKEGKKLKAILFSSSRTKEIQLLCNSFQMTQEELFDFLVELGMVEYRRKNLIRERLVTRSPLKKSPRKS